MAGALVRRTVRKSRPYFRWMDVSLDFHAIEMYAVRYRVRQHLEHADQAFAPQLLLHSAEQRDDIDLARLRSRRRS